VFPRCGGAAVPRHDDFQVAAVQRMQLLVARPDRMMEERQRDWRAGSRADRIIGDRGRRVVVAEEVDKIFPLRLALVMVAT